MPVRRMDHVALRVNDPDATARWYEQTLGLTSRFVGVWGPGAPLMLGAGDCCVALVAGEPPGFAHLAFEVAPEDLDEIQQPLVGAGTPIRHANHGINHSIYFTDPNGIEIELTAYKTQGGTVPDSPKRVVSALVETMFNRHDLDAADALVAPDVIDHSGFPGQPPGLDGMKQRWGMLLKAFPDFCIEIHGLVAEGESVSMRATGRGTHQGDFFGIAPTGRPIVFTEINISRVVDGRMVEHWAERSNLEVMQQLGAVTAAPGEPQGGNQ